MMKAYVKKYFDKFPHPLQKKLYTIKRFCKEPNEMFPSFFSKSDIGSKIYYYLAKLCKQQQFKKGSNLIELPCNPHNTISEDKGYLKINFSNDPFFQECIKHCQHYAEELNFEEMAEQAKKKFLVQKNIDLSDPFHKPIKDFILSKELIAIVSQYLGTVPIIYYTGIWYSPNKTMETGRSQEYHLDNEDIKQVKCFIPLKDITEHSGPLTIIPSKESKEIYKKLKKEKHIKHKSAKVPDEVIFQYTEKKNEKKLTAHVGEVAMVDTCNCYHYGSRPAPETRLLLHIQFFSPYSTEVPFLLKGNLQGGNDNSLEKNIFAYYHLTKDKFNY